MRLLLASRGIPDLAALLGARGRQAILIPDAADPHDDHPGRHDKHLAAQAAFGDRLRLVALRDGDVFVYGDGHESIRRR